MPLRVFDIVVRALWFVFANFFTLVRLIWLPLSLLLAAEYALAYLVVSLHPEAIFSKIVSSPAVQLASLVALLFEGLAFSVIAVQIHRIILFGERRPNTYFVFPFGKTEFLYVLMGGASFLFILLVAGVPAAMAATVPALLSGADPVAALVAAQKEWNEQTSPPTLTLVLPLIVGYPLAVWAVCRLILWPPAVVANNRLSLGEALRLSRGRVYEFIGLWLASIVPFLPLAIVAGVSAYYDFEWVREFDPRAGDFEGKLQFLLYENLTTGMVIFDFVRQFVFASYTFAILSYAYKALKGYDPSLPIGAQTESPDETEELSAEMKPMGAL